LLLLSICKKARFTSGRPVIREIPAGIADHQAAKARRRRHALQDLLWKIIGRKMS